MPMSVADRRHAQDWSSENMVAAVHLWITHCGDWPNGKVLTLMTPNARLPTWTLHDSSTGMYPAHESSRHLAPDWTLGQSTPEPHVYESRLKQGLILRQAASTTSFSYYLLSAVIVDSARTMQAVERPFKACRQQAQGNLRFPSPHSPNSSASSASSTKRLTASPPPKPTPKRTSKTPVPCLKATCNPSSPSAAKGGWRICLAMYVSSHKVFRWMSTCRARQKKTRVKLDF